MYMTHYNEKNAENLRERREEEKFQRALSREITSRAALSELGALRSLYGMHARKDRKRA